MKDFSLLFENARINTLDANHPLARAMLVSQGNIIALFDDPMPSPSGYGDLHRIKCENLVMLPAFTDSHVHLMHTGENLETVDVSEAHSEQEVVAILRKAFHDKPRGEWLQGSRWVYNQWTPPDLPSKKSLDQAFPDNPVYLFSKCGHLLWVNSPALKAAGVTADTPDPPGGAIQKDSVTGEPTGIFKENADAVYKVIPPFSDARKKDLLKNAARYFNRFGFVNVHANDSSSVFSLLQDLQSDPDFSLNVVIYIPDSLLDSLIQSGLKSGFGDDSLRLGGIKLFLDGSLGGRTAWLYEPYENEPDNTGICAMERPILTQTLLRAKSHGISSMTHAIGDRAVNMLLETYAELQKDYPPHPDCIFADRIEHFQMISEKTQSLLKQCRGVASVQPIHIFGDWAAADDHWGKRARYAYAFQTMVQAGFPLVFGSDSPVEPINPFWGIYAAVERKDQDSLPPNGWRPEQKLSLSRALEAFCVTPPIIVGEGARKGTLSPGKRADFVLLDQDPFHVSSPEILKDIRIMATASKGTFVYRA
ncbi:amidohydrolase [Candidatus Sumerlaeota bacterium]|nr:amidohydrolase [Candidatus Sumerlaeota bacterium]